MKRVLPWSLALSFLAGCSSSSSSVTSSADAGGDATTATYASSACGMCVANACASETQACAADPQCAQYLSCVETCPLADSGNVDADCAGGCTVPPTDPGLGAQQAYDRCRQQGAGAACPDCGGTDGGVAEAASDGGLLHENCPPSTSTNACAKCGAQSCCEPSAACAADPECSAVGTCINGCISNPGDAGKYPCENACFAAHSAKSVAEWGSLYICGTVLCSAPTACNNTGKCIDCVVSKCGNQYAACFQDTACIQRFYCGLACGTDVACQGACSTKFNAGVSHYDAFTTCESNLCINECG